MSILQKIEPLTKQRLFAVIHMFGKQRVITQGDLVTYENFMPLECGQKFLINKCLVLGGKDFSIIGRPLLDKELFRIEATIVEKTMTDHRIEYRHTPRQHGLKKFLHHAEPRTVFRISKIELSKLPEC